MQTTSSEDLKPMNIPILIDNPANISDPWPLTCGVPFPQGLLNNTSALHVENGKGEMVPCQIDVTATWLQDKSIRWALVNFQGRPDKPYFLKAGREAPAEAAGGMEVKEQGGDVTVNTGAAEFTIGKHDALVARASFGGRLIIKDSGCGAYVVDNKGRKARLGGRNSQMDTRFRAKGPFWTVLRKEGWYVTDKNERIARGIVWMHFYGNSPYVKVVHRLVLTEDTNKLWFKDIGIDFQVGFEGDTRATFETSKGIDSHTTMVALGAGESAWMLQDDFPHFVSKTSHFSLVHQRKTGPMEVTSGKACGDSCSLLTDEAGLAVVLRDFAEQFPKEFTVSPDKIEVHLWAGRCGRELDFRTETLIKEYWGEWCDYASLPREKLARIRSNAIASAKTHTLWLIPCGGISTAKQLAGHARLVAAGVLAVPDPKWTCGTGTMGPPMHPKDVKQFPREEAYISDSFDRLMYPNKTFPHTGYIAWGKCPNIRSYSWWRISNAIDYHMRKNTWLLYARSGERKYFEFGDRFNRFMGDMCTHHWDVPPDPDVTRESQWFDVLSQGTQRVRGGWADGTVSKDIDRQGVDLGDLPLYWRWSSGKIGGGSGVDLINYLIHFYFTGDWHIWELAEDYGTAMKKWDFLQQKKPHRGVIELRCIAGLYSMSWDETFGDMARNLANQFIDLESPCGFYEEMEPSPLYKTSRNLVSLYEYYRLTGSELAKKAFLKMVEYKYRFLMYPSSIAYQNAIGMENATAYFLTRDPKYMNVVAFASRLAMKSFTSTLEEDLRLEKEGREGIRTSFTMSFNYHPCLSTPVMLKAISEYKGEVKLFPVLRKNYDSTRNAWAVFRKEENQSVSLEILFTVLQAEDVEPVVLGPDLNPVDDAEIVEKQRDIDTPWSTGSTGFYVRMTIPAHLPSGTYRAGHANRGGFTVSSATIEQVALECPEGFWLGKVGMEAPGAFYFKVPEHLDNVELFVNTPLSVTRANGLDARDAHGRKYGEMVIAVASRNPGCWKIHSDQTAFVRLRNIPPVVSYLLPDRLVAPDKLMEVTEKTPSLPAADDQYVEGVMGRALQIKGRSKLRFERGESLAGGDYENFPGYKGTIEFWFRPNWTAVSVVMPDCRDYSRMLFDAGVIHLRYHYGQRSYKNEPENDLVFQCGKSVKEVKKNRYKHFGSHARIYPEAGEWMHIAATWDVSITSKEALGTKYRREDYTRGKKCETFFVFVNGKRHSRISVFHAAPIYLHLGRRFAEDYELVPVPEWITLAGVADGTFDELRISDVVRYTKDFAPPQKPFKLDEHTKALLHFDGNTEGIGGDGEKLKVEYDLSQPGKQ